MESQISIIPWRAGIVVIGRNEGPRLLECLRSLQGLEIPSVYVDSGSKDSSAQRAITLCGQVIELDPSRPFSAARARNEGFAALLERHPAIDFVQFLDGDCTLLTGWVEAALESMGADLKRAVVIGPLQERRPEASIYNRLCAMEWKSPVGELASFGALGGIMLVRATVFRQLGGFNDEVIAGEDAEFGVRVAEAGFKITKIETAMATHDAAIERFGQWWRRAVRSGHAIGQRFSLHGHNGPRDCARERRSVVLWGCVLPATIVVLAPFTHGLSALMGLTYVALGWRIARYRRLHGDSVPDSRLYACFVVAGKFAEAVGLLRFGFNRFAGRFRIIEYK